ncbi:MAG: hypothetical protein F4X83_00255 [Chloroflexi bacterium]|nr:hypothetical protein [Chloroflexota bacterium]
MATKKILFVSLFVLLALIIMVFVVSMMVRDETGQEETAGQSEGDSSPSGAREYSREELEDILASSEPTSSEKRIDINKFCSQNSDECLALVGYPRSELLGPRADKLEAEGDFCGEYRFSFGGGPIGEHQYRICGDEQAYERWQAFAADIEELDSQLDAEFPSTSGKAAWQAYLDAYDALVLEMDKEYPGIKDVDWDNLKDGEWERFMNYEEEFEAKHEEIRYQHGLVSKLGQLEIDPAKEEILIKRAEAGQERFWELWVKHRVTYSVSHGIAIYFVK